MAPRGNGKKTEESNHKLAPKKALTKPKRHSDEMLKEAILKCGGVVTTAAESLGYSRAALVKRIAVSPELQAIVHEARESMIDLAESGLFAALRTGAQWAIMYALNNLGRRRGYNPPQASFNLNANLPVRKDVALDLSNLNRRELEDLRTLYAKMPQQEANGKPADIAGRRPGTC